MAQKLGLTTLPIEPVPSLWSENKLSFADNCLILQVGRHFFVSRSSQCETEDRWQWGYNASHDGGPAERLAMPPRFVFVSQAGCTDSSFPDLDKGPTRL